MKTFEFKGGAGRNFIFVGIAATLLLLFTFGLAYPWAVTMFYKWKASHTYIDGRQLKFVGSGGELIGMWIWWFILTVVTLGLYSLVWYPRFVKWVTERTVFANQ